MAVKGGSVAGRARLSAEKDLNVKVVSSENYLHLGRLKTQNEDSVPEKLDNKGSE